MLGDGRWPNYLSELYQQKNTVTEYRTDASRKYGMMDRRISDSGLDEMHEEQKRVLADNSLGESILYEHEQPREYSNSRQVLNLMYEGGRQGDPNAVNLPDGTFYDFQALIPEDRNINFDTPIRQHRDYFARRVRNLPKFSDLSVGIPDTPVSDFKLREQRKEITKFLQKRLQNFDTSLSNLHRKDAMFSGRSDPRLCVRDTQDKLFETELTGNKRSKHQQLEDYVLRGQLSVTDHRVPEGYYNITRGLRKPDADQAGVAAKCAKYDIEFAHPSLAVDPQRALPHKMIDAIKKHNDTQLSVESVNKLLFKDSMVSDVRKRKRKHDSAKQLQLRRDGRVSTSASAGLRETKGLRSRADHGFAPQYEDIRASVSVFAPRIVRDLCDQIRRAKKESDDFSVAKFMEFSAENWSKLSKEQKIQQHSNVIYRNMTNTAWMEEQDAPAARGEILAQNQVGKAGLTYAAPVAPNHPHLSDVSINPAHDVRDHINLRHKHVRQVETPFAHMLYKHDTPTGTRGRDFARPPRGYRKSGCGLSATLNSSEWNDTLGNGPREL